MRRAARFLVVLLAALALLAIAAYFVLTHTARGWFEGDLALRSQLAVTSARQSLSSRWGEGG
jgi:hypothetical protein